MGLRLAEGVDMARHARLAGRRLDASVLARLADLGLVTVSGDHLAATAPGRAVLNGVLRELL